MIITRKEKIIRKNISILTKGRSALVKPYKTKKMQSFKRTTFSVLFIPIFTYDEVL